MNEQTVMWWALAAFGCGGALGFGCAVVTIVLPLWGAYKQLRKMSFDALDEAGQIIKQIGREA